MALSRNVPDSFKESLEILATLPEPDMVGIVSTLRRNPVIGSRDEVRSAFLRASERASEDALKELAILVMAFARINYDREDEAVSTLTGLSEGGNLDLDDQQRETLKNRLIEVSRLPGLMLAARASNEERNHERLLTDSNVVTDLRPLFDNNGRHAIVIPWHTLNLRFTSRQYNEDQSESVVMDYLDLLKLRYQIDEALEHRVLIQSEMIERGIPVWDPYIPEDKNLKEED
jgi:hypothetical protein